MSTKAILVELDACVGCYACVVACNLFYQVNAEEARIKVHTIGPETIDGRNKIDFIPLMTEKCELGRYETEPPCVRSCPVRALKWCDERETLAFLGDGRRYQICKIE